MYYTSIMNQAEKIKTIKKALATKYGYKNVSVRNGTGTAWGWVEVRIYVEGETKGIREEAEKIIKETGVELYTYTDDMGYDHEELLVEVRNYKYE